MMQEQQQRRHPFDQGPHLSAAFLCERVLIEQDGVKSAIRIVDRTTRTVIGPSPPPEMPPFPHSYFLLLRLKSGQARGPATVTIRFVKPSGESPTPLIQTIHFEGEDDRGVDLVTQLQVEFDRAGLYWFDVYLDDVRITRIPLRIVYQPQIMQTGIGGTPRPPAEGPA